MVDEIALRKHSLELARTRLKVLEGTPRRFVFLTDVYEFYHDSNMLSKGLNVSPNRLESICNYELGVIYDPWASVIALSFKDIPIYETTITGYKLWESPRRKG